MVLDVQLAGGQIGRRHDVGVRLEDATHQLGHEITVLRLNHGQPRSDGGPHGRVFESGMEAGQLLEGYGGGVGRHAPRAVGECAPAGGQVLEKQDEATVIG